MCFPVEGKARAALERARRFSNAELLTSAPFNYDADVNPRIIAPDPFASSDSFDVFALENQPILTKLADDTMNSEDEPSSGLNGRLRPRKSAVSSPQAPKASRKPESKPAQDRPKRTSTPSKAAATKPDDLVSKSDLSTAPQFLCPYCDRKFASKQTASKHARRIHLSNTKQDSFIDCLFCNFAEADPVEIIRHMVDSHPNQYFACLDCHTRFQSTSELAEHKLNACEKQKEKPYRSKLRQKVSTGSKKSQKALNIAEDKDISNDKDFPDGHRFNGIVISCELKPSQDNDEADIEDNITTNLILPPSKTLGTNAVIEKNAVIVLDDIQWNKRMPTNFSFHNTDADQILSRLGVVHRSPRTGESTKKDWFKNAEEPVQKFEKCFDTGFYSKVASNVHENLSKFLDGSFNFNPDPDSVIKTRKSKNSVIINTAEGFPILLAFEQYSRSVFDSYLPRTLAPKHKWKWENDKSPLHPDDIKRDSHVNNCIITLVSSLDIWTQLCMRRKFEDKFSIPPLEKKTEKQNTISKELKQILESRELPKSSQQVMKYTNKPMPSGESLDFPASLGLKPSAPTYDMQPAVLSGEWVRPRCYVCCACGAQTRDSRGLSSHISTQHPNAQVQHYEIVGELLLNADILKHLYVPPSQMCNRTRPLRGFRECTKCKKSISLEDLHQHMLDCAGDTPAVRRKCRYRPFGVRRRRPRLPDNTIRKKIRKDIRSRQTRQKTHMRPRPKIRSEVGDAETIRKMLADLPAKRHRVMVNPLNPALRPRRKLDKQRNKIIMKRRSSEMAKNRRREMKKINDHPTGSSAGDDDNKSNKSDDDKPLKPRIKRVLTHAPRPSDTLKRKVALSRAKRRAKIKELRSNDNAGQEKQPVDMSGGGPSSSGNRGDQLSIDNSPQGIDVNGGPSGARQRSGRSRSNNRDTRDDQRSGSGDSPNGDMNNSFGSKNNTPLKHSIARLTAETDAQDRGLQYHHLYLMQPPDCTEIDMSPHVPSGQQRVFENEAVVTKLDKPPLHFNPSTPMDAYAYHRNKLPKPKKGLNDCIAMLKNKLVDPIPTAKISHAMPCGGDDRLECETLMANQRPPALEYQLNMNTRPAEIFSRHQLTPERYMEYPADANLMVQNFAELPFHFVPTQRIAFDLPPPDSRTDSRYSKASKQKQNEATAKKEPVRRRSTRTDKNTAKKQDLNSRTHYPVSVPTSMKVNSGQGRRSSQSVSANPNTVAAKRRASVSYNRSNTARKHLNEYEAIMARQRALEFCQQRVSPEGHLMELALPETYTQTQINTQNHLIAEQFLESYISKKQLAICVDNNYANKMLTAAYAESMYANSRHASISPGNTYDNNMQLSVSPGSRYDSNKHLSVSPGSRYDNSKRPTVSPGTKYDNNKQTNVSPGSKYDSRMQVNIAPGSGHDNSKHAVISPGSRLGNNLRASISPGNKQAALSPELPYDTNKLATVNDQCKSLISPVNRYDSSRLTSVSPGTKHDSTRTIAYSPETHHDNTMHESISPANYDHIKQAAMFSGNSYDSKKQHANVSPVAVYDDGQHLAPGNTYDSGKHTSVSPGAMYESEKSASVSPKTQYDINTHANVSPGSNYDSSKRTSVSPGSNYISKKQAAVAADSNYNNKKQAVTSENNYYKKQQIASPENAYNITSDVVSTESEIRAQVPITFAESAFISKKAQAVAGENKLSNRGQPKPNAETNYSARASVMTHESNTINEIHATQALIHAETNYASTQAAISNENRHLAKKQDSNDSSLTIASQPSVSNESRYVDKSQVTSNTSYISKTQAPIPENYSSNQVMQCQENNFMNKDLPQVLPDRDTAPRKFTVDYYSASGYSMQPVQTTYPTVNNTYETMPNDIEAPLDLSKSTSKDNDEMLKNDDGAFASDNYDNYETLDLSNKGSEQDNEDVIVDLSIKISSADMSSKQNSVTNDEVESATDLSVKTRDVDDSPTDLTVRRKSVNDGYDYEPNARNSNYVVQEMIQDLSGKKTPPDNHGMTLSTRDVEPQVPTDLSGKSQEVPLPLTAANMPGNLRHSVELISDNRRNQLPADMSGIDQLKQSNPVVHLQESLTPLETNLEKDKNAYANRPSRGECSYSLKPVYDSSAHRMQYEVQTPPNPCNANVDETRCLQQSNSANLSNDNKIVDDVAFANTAAVSVTTVVGGANNLVSSAAEPIPLYSLSNTIMPIMSKYESTKPVYTLANACISMAKAEPSNRAPLSDAMLSIPSTTIVSAAPVYTLTDTTVNPSMNYMQLHAKSSPDVNTSPATQSQSDASCDSNPERTNVYISSTSPPAAPLPLETAQKADKVATISELDPETAKKIALLPKELVEILGTMPVDHRNQLLNVLPQYVSASAPTTNNDSSDMPTISLVNRGVSPTRISEGDVKPSLSYSPVSSSQVIRPISAMLPTMERNEESKCFPLYQQTIGSNLIDGQVSKYEPLEQIAKVYEIDGNTVIDLTEDDAPPNNEAIKVTETPNNDSKENETLPLVVPPISKTIKPKVNDQTASLRAVRIKAPSERNKSISTENMPLRKSNEQVKSNTEIIEDKDTSDLDKTLAIQQAEISSTQHNTTIGGNCKYPLAISPSSTEYSGDESGKPVPQPSPIPTNEIVSDEPLENKYEKPIPKTGMVSSSISTNDINPSDGDYSHAAINLPKELDKNTPSALLTHEKDYDVSIEKVSSEGNSAESQMDNPKTHMLDHVEDSDDDISLAAIVKQKQSQVKVNDNVQTEKNIGSKKKKKDKKGKKVTKKTLDDTRELTDTSDSVKDVEYDSSLRTQTENTRIVRSSVSVNQGNNNKIFIESTDHEEINKHSKKKSRKGRRFTEALEMEKDRTNIVPDETEKDINKENDCTSEVINNKVSSEENCSGLDIVNQPCGKDKDSSVDDKFVSEESDVSHKTIKPKLMKEIIADPIIKISKCDEKVTAYSTKSAKELTKIKDKKKKHDLTKMDQQEKTYNENNHEETVCSTAELNSIDDDDPISTPVKQRVTIDNDEFISGNDQDDTVEAVETKKSKKTLRSKKARNESASKRIEQEIDSSENALELKENITIPLRRSRRGKSMFLDSTTIEPESALLDEVTVEQKGPITKKQLIFSKYMLDEGSPKPAAHSTPQKENLNKNDANELIVDSAMMPEVSDIQNVDEVYTEKPKGTKRRISAQFPKRTKKKKSIDDTNATGDDTPDLDKVQSSDCTDENPTTPKEINSDSNKSHKTRLSGNITDSEKLDEQSSDINDSKSVNDKHTLSTEKRKNNHQISFDLSQSSKPKKSKLNKNDKKMDIVANDEVEDSKVDESIPTGSETKTACYNLPLPARRARSKSVGVKTSTYDPYDIDLEDMIEQNEMFKRNEKKTDHVAKTKINKSRNLVSTDTNMTTNDSRRDYRTRDAISKTNRSHDTADFESGAISDSDDSSKSDVPLQKYVEEKEKKNQEVEAIISKESKHHSEKQQTNETMDAKRLPAEILHNATQAQAEQELRSEQFMESFGFFSERKPRKSNLLATKKISETFHITNESDDMYFGFKERSGRKSGNSDSKKPIESEIPKILPQPSTSKRAPPKRGRRTKKAIIKIMPSYCGVCKKEFRRPDNYLRHQMSLLHISKLSDAELKVKTVPVHEEPNYLIAYKQYLHRLKKLTDLLAKKKKKFPKAAAKIVLPTLEEVLADVNKTVRDQQRCARGLSRDEALFLDCCELLRESHNLGARGIKRFGMSGLDFLEKAIDDLDVNESLMSDDGDCDSITAQNILESEEVRNLENDLISGLQEAANATRNANMEYQHTLDEFAAPPVVQMVEREQGEQIEQAAVAKQTVEAGPPPQDNQVETEPQEENVHEASEEFADQQLSSPNVAEASYDHVEDFDVPAKPRQVKVKKHYEVKEKMYPDIQIEDIDMFEDKFDKIKRKCRSQAAAAKQPQPVVDQSISHKGRKKSEKKKAKKSAKKARHQSSHVPTKGALKGFDGIKVSIPTSDINMSAIVPVSESSPKKKKKSSSKKRRDKRDSESSSKYDSDHRAKDSSAKKVDVYEFMDNEDAELFEFRPSTLMERFKSISNNKDMPNTSKFNPVAEENSSQGSASDGDDFVYMSDDYVGSDDETENSLLSCELGNGKVGADIKKNSPQKRRDAVEKNAVMGKIFKHNAVRAEKKIAVPKEPEKPKANLDQLFDSLLEEEPNSSALNSEAVSPKDDSFTPVKKYNEPSTSAKSISSDKDDDVFAYPSQSRSSSPNKNAEIQSSTLSKRRSSSPSKGYVSSTKKHESLSSKKYDPVEVDYGLSTSKKYESTLDVTDYAKSSSKKYHDSMPKDCKMSTPKDYDTVPVEKDDDISYKNYESTPKKRNDSLSSKHDDELYNTYDDDSKSSMNKPDEGISTSYDYSAEVYDQSLGEDDTGVARHRARRKCTVGKQNVLAETWSSESEPDGGPPRPNSAESDIAAVGRKKKGRKKEGQQTGRRRGNGRQGAYRKQDIESRVSSSRVSSIAAGAADADDSEEAASGMCGTSGCASGGGEATAAAPAVAMPAPVAAACAAPAAPAAKGRPRSGSYWATEEEQERLQQHGWIVGDSHKKLVTMLAHAKGRKRNNDDKRHLVE